MKLKKKRAKALLWERVRTGVERVFNTAVCEHDAAYMLKQNLMPKGMHMVVTFATERREICIGHPILGWLVYVEKEGMARLESCDESYRGPAKAQRVAA